MTQSRSDERTVEVTFAYPYRDAAGVEHDVDSTAALPLEEGKTLLHYGRAREPEKKATKAAAKKEQ